jgi:3-phenylpropionate/trans-cinnamate dioxygenase ferredoxin subunit
VGEFVPVGKLNDIGDGEIAPFDAGNVRIAIANIDGSLYAIDDTCTHMGCSLADGDVEATTVVCPCHGGEFDLETGEVLEGPPTEPVHTYEVRVRDGIVEVALD